MTLAASSGDGVEGDDVRGGGVEGYVILDPRGDGHGRIVHLIELEREAVGAFAVALALGKAKGLRHGGLNRGLHGSTGYDRTLDGLSI